MRGVDPFVSLRRFPFVSLSLRRFRFALTSCRSRGEAPLLSPQRRPGGGYGGGTGWVPGESRGVPGGLHSTSALLQTSQNVFKTAPDGPKFVHKASKKPKMLPRGSKTAPSGLQDRFFLPTSSPQFQKSLKLYKQNNGFQILGNFNRRHMLYQMLKPTWAYLDVKIRSRRPQVASKTP